MRKDLADIVCCPVHKGRLVLSVAELDPRGDIVRGAFRCEACDFDYPIEEGIPNLLPPEYHVDQVREAAKPAAGSAKTAPAAKASKGTTAKAGKA